MKTFSGMSNNAWVATDVGLLRGVHFKTEQNTVVTYDQVSKQNEVVSLTKADGRPELFCTLKSSLINVFDLSQNIYVNQFEMEGDLLTAFEIKDTFISVAKSGQVYVWKDEEVTEKFKIGLNTECCSRTHDGRMISGGKENELKVWDLETQKPIFTSKNVKRDDLDIRMPVWVRSVTTLRTESNVISVGTQYHQYRQYDIRVKRRPVIEISWGELPIISLAATDTHCFMGNGKGDLGQVDLRMAKNVSKFKGAVGSIRSLAVHHNEPYLASVGLDRHLRVHNINTKELEHKFYLKNKLNCVVFTDEVINEKVVEEDIWDQLEETASNKRIKL